MAALFITCSEKWWHIDGVPTWNQIFGAADLSDEYTAVTDSEVTVHFIDVGQGDCELIMTPDKNVLIDCGEKEYSDAVIAYLKAQNITRLDYIIVTHPHSDHAGGMSYIINEFETGTVIMPKIKDSVVPTTSTYKRLLKAISKNNVSVEYAKAGAEYDLGGGSKMDIIAPVGDYDDLNNYSVVMKFTHGSNSFLFTGDIEKQAESDILDSGADIGADVVKVAHHGSSTSSTKAFIKAVSPRIAVVEVGSPNSYNHPNKDTLKRYGKVVDTIYRTDINGSIVFESDGEGFNIITEKGGDE